MQTLRLHWVEWVIGDPYERIVLKNTTSTAASGVEKTKIERKRTIISNKSFFDLDRREAAPRIVRRPHNAHVLEGNNAIFDCRIIALSPPIVSW